MKLEMIVDPLAALQSVFQTYVSYQSDDATPLTENYANNGLEIEVFPFALNKQRIAPLITIGPILSTIVKPQNIGNSPNSRWLHKYMIECHILTQTYQSPNISGYNAAMELMESVRQIIVQNQTSVDGSGNWLLMKLSKGPFSGPETKITPDRYDLIFLVELWRSVVN